MIPTVPVLNGFNTAVLITASGSPVPPFLSEESGNINHASLSSNPVAYAYSHITPLYEGIAACVDTFVIVSTHSLVIREKLNY
jgi:hypothetical protein